MATTEYEPDATVMGQEALRHGALRPLGVHVVVRGRLHLCLANVGKSLLSHSQKASMLHWWHASLAGYLLSQHQPLDGCHRQGHKASGCACGPCLAASAVARLWGGWWCGLSTMYLGASKQHGAEGEACSTHGCTWWKTTLVRTLVFPEPAGCFYFMYLILCPVNVR